MYLFSSVALLGAVQSTIRCVITSSNPKVSDADKAAKPIGAIAKPNIAAPKQPDAKASADLNKISAPIFARNGAWRGTLKNSSYRYIAGIIVNAAPIAQAVATAVIGAAIPMPVTVNSTLPAAPFLNPLIPATAASPTT